MAQPMSMSSMLASGEQSRAAETRSRRLQGDCSAHDAYPIRLSFALCSRIHLFQFLHCRPPVLQSAPAATRTTARARTFRRRRRRPRPRNCPRRERRNWQNMYGKRKWHRYGNTTQGMRPSEPAQATHSRQSPVTVAPFSLLLSVRVRNCWPISPSKSKSTPLRIQS